MIAGLLVDEIGTLSQAADSERVAFPNSARDTL